jgi:3-isopropylmalate dehydrogenase
MFFVTAPERFDVVVTDNLSATSSPTSRGDRRRHRPGRQRQHRRHPHCPVHVRAGARAAPRTSRGKGKADPTAAVLSVALLLEHLGHAEQARRVRLRRRGPQHPR